MNWQLQKEKGKKRNLGNERIQFSLSVSEGGECACFIAEITAAENIEPKD